ncbi:MAG TPA: LuxR C-terminal-related transcriptional regulator [Trebonia sp.]|nr:LuxR C-terminal-related transcriptional regulator [Trebonia sp.]
MDKASDVPLVLLSAGPGAGKTVLLAEWARRRRSHVAWLCPTPDDNEPARFRALLTAALRVPRLDFPDVDQAGVADFVYWLREQLTDRRAPVVLAIDDAHVLTSPEIIDLLDQLVCHGSPRLHLVLSARHDPPLPLHRYRLAGQTREIRVPDLAMTLGEIHEVLIAHQVRLPVSAENALAARTEGWAAGVQLTAMRMEHSPAPHQLVDELSFDYGGVGEYFTAEVLAQLPDTHRRLLIETSFLDEVTAPLAEAITGLDGAGQMLTELARGNWFVVALDPAGTRFRYHRIFAEVLRYLLRRDRKRTMPELAARAASCFAHEGDHERALYWSAMAGDPHHVAAMLVRGGLADAFAHQRDIPSAALEAVLPLVTADGAAARDADIVLADAVLRAATAVPGVAAVELERFQNAAVPGMRPDESTRRTAALVELMLGMRSSDRRAVDTAAAHLLNGQLPSGLCGAVLLAKASTHFWDGAPDDVDALLSEALSQAQRGGTVRLQAEVLGMIACVDAYRSRPRHADDAALRAHQLIRAHPGLRTPSALRLATAVRSVQKADLTAAARELRHASVPAAVSADQGLGAAFTLWRASVLALSGKPHEARVLLESETGGLSPSLLQAHRDIIFGEVETSLGRPQGALRYFEPHRKGRLAALADVPCARAYLALGDLQSARQSIRGALGVTDGHLSRYVLVEAMLLGSRIAGQSHDTGRALEMMTNALDVAHEELRLPFVLTRDTLGELLARHPALADRWPSPPASAAWDAGPTVTADRVIKIPVQLTQREASVLAYLPTSMTAAEVADELYLSVNTVKTHLAAIYRKLGVRGRREAVRHARELELL